MEEHKILKIIKESEHLPPIPKNFGEILRMLLEPVEYDIDQCVENFLRFPQLGEALIKIVNHNANLSREIKSVKDAINYLGAQRSRIIAVAYVTRLLLPDREDRSKIISNKKYWRHCLGTAIAAYLIAEETKLTDKEKIFTYGLVHDIGITVMNICLPDHLDKILELQKKGLHQIVAEKSALGGMTHGEVGMWLCKQWNLPDELAEIVCYHHTPLLARNYINEVYIMHLADSISTDFYEALLGTETTFVYADKIRESLNLDKEFINEISKRLPSEINKLNRKIKF